MRSNHVPGLSVAIAKDGRLVYVEAFGEATRDPTTPLTPSHRFRIASITKTLTAATLFTLIEEGRVALSARIFGPGSILGTEYGRPPYRRWITDITLEHLLTHTAGGWTNDGSDPMFANPEMNHIQLISWVLADRPLAHPPGTHYAYSNFGFCVLGRVIEHLTGRPYPAAVAARVLERCGIRDMRIAGNTLRERAPNEVVYYGTGGENPYDMNVARMDSHGGWLATPTDLVRFCARMSKSAIRGEILKPESVRAMTTPSRVNASYAKGWSITEANYWHNGSLPGTSTIMVHTGDGFAWAGLTNTRNADVGGALDQLMWEMVGKVSVWPTWDLFG